MEKMIEVKDLSFEINDKLILDNIQMYVEKGEFISIIGPNGAGKTTLVKCLNKNLNYRGQVNLKGKDLNSYSFKEKARIVAVVPQEYNLPFNFKVMDIVRMGRNPYHRKFENSDSIDSEIVNMALHQTNTYEFKDRFYNSLSGGEKQRVVAARALAQEPEMLFLDEITSNLDIHNQLEVLELIRKINKENGMTVVSIMHDLNLASRFSDRILLLIGGKIEIFDKPSKVINEQVLSKAYNMEMIIRENRILDFSEVVPLRIKRDLNRKNIKIHVVSGGGTGEYILEKLYSMKYDLTCGILLSGDSDLDICNSLKIEYVCEKPYSEISEESMENNKIFINEADLILLTDVPFGKANIENLEMVSKIENKPVIVLENRERDHMDGFVDSVLEAMYKRKNVHLVEKYNDIFGIISNLELDK
jgi:iron complex transport system ATP-binding protein